MRDIIDALAKLPESKVRFLVRASKWTGRKNALEREADSIRHRLERVQRDLVAVNLKLGGPVDKRRRKAARKHPKALGKKTRKHGFPRVPLKTFLMAILKKRLGKPMAAPELAKAALADGYKTKSKPEMFVRATYQALATQPEFKKAGRGLYTLK